MSTTNDDRQADADLQRRFQRELMEMINRAVEKGYRAGYYNGFVSGFPAGFREAVRDKSVPIMKAGWDQVPDEVVETKSQYCQVVMKTLHMAREPGWELLPFEKFWDDAEGQKAD
jgi:hypothetical protein